jgi:mono/diheme cytochrome c family protein
MKLLLQASPMQTRAAFTIVLYLAPTLALAGPDFEAEIRPLFEAHCIQCHGPEEQNGGLRYDRRDRALGQADSGEYAIVPGDPERSQILQRVRSTHKDLQMPPKGTRLTAKEIDSLRAWIAAGAPWPEESGETVQSDPGSSHWAFQAIRQPEIPPVRDPGWARNPIDRFIQAKREAAGLTAVPDADPVTLVRRLSYALTGLPPGSAELEGGDLSELTEALLSSSAYGERWARHWLDWVRYADTAGDNSDFPIPQAYLYRNYVVESFNKDLPYDQFLTEQLAGDLLPATDQAEKNRLTIATGYLAMARRFGSLLERYPHHLTIEDTLDNLGRSVMGLTLSCARCHDHKFDPISTRDYYGLYGIFESTRYPFPGLELFQAQRHLVPLLPAGEVKKKLEPHQKELDRLSAELEKHLTACEAKALENAGREAQVSVDEQRRMRSELDAMLGVARKAGEALARHLKTLPVIPSAYAVQDGKAADARIQIKGEPTRPGALVPRKFLDVLGGQALDPDTAAGTSGRLQLAQWLTDEQNPLTARVIVNRIWQRHFGSGLVPGSGDFGLRGEPPTHPELLDWLASDFIQHGWSIKHLHRRIVSSRTWQMASVDDEDNLASDPANTYYWRFNRQRLDAESLRDTLLFLSGELDPTPQSAPYPMPPPKDWGYTQHHPFKDDYPSNKRSLYQMTKRLTVQPYLQTFDGPDPNACTSTRDSSVTAIQALHFLNDASLHRAAEGIVKTLALPGQEPAMAVNRLHRHVLSRAPGTDELELILSHFQSLQAHSKDPARAWRALTRALLRSNEFVYLD